MSGGLLPVARISPLCRPEVIVRAPVFAGMRNTYNATCAGCGWISKGYARRAYAERACKRHAAEWCGVELRKELAKSTINPLLRDFIEGK